MPTDLWKLLPNVIIDKQKVYVLYYYCHLVKSVRNGLFNNNIIIADETISWKIITDIYNCEKMEILKTVLKLTEAHVYPTYFRKLSVSLATQVFSHNVGSAIECAIACDCFEKDGDIRKLLSLLLSLLQK